LLEFSVIRRTFFPLRSSAGWFESQATVSALEKHIKLSLVCFDELIFQDGEFFLGITDNGSLSFFMPPGTRPNQYRELPFGKGKDFSLQLAPEGSQEYIMVVAGPATTSYQVDFYPILKSAGLLGQEYIKGLTDDFEGDVKKHFGTQISDDKFDSQIALSLSSMSLEKNYIIESYYIDSYAAHQLRASINFDSRVGSFIVVKNHQLTSQYIPDISSLVFDTVLNLEVPDFRELSWDKIHEVRQSSAGQSFRDMLQRIQLNIIEEIKTDLELQEVVNKNFQRELVDEMSESAPDKGLTTLNLLCLLIPLFLSAPPIVSVALGSISIVNEIQNHLKVNQSWASLIPKPKRT
jgi:hypothetical protein